DSSGSSLSGARYRRRGSPGEVRLSFRGIELRSTSPRRNRDWTGSNGHASGPGEVNPRSHCFSEDSESHGLDVQRSIPRQRETAPGASHSAAFLRDFLAIITAVRPDAPDASSEGGSHLHSV